MFSEAKRERKQAHLGALLSANVRYWTSVAPIVRGELARWRGLAESIPDQPLRELALSKLDGEAFNAEVAATLATLAPRRHRPAAVRAIVALEVLFDYLDGRTELPSEDPIALGERLFAALSGAVESQRGPLEDASLMELEDGAYLLALADGVRVELRRLPATANIADTAGTSARRCAQAQVHLHAWAELSEGQLRDWAWAGAAYRGLGWREYLGGSASSVLSLHALIAAAASPSTSTADAQMIDAAYLAIGGVITMLDSLVDLSADEARGEVGFVRLFATHEEIEQCLRDLTREALERARRAPHGGHHAMTLAGAGAYYTTHPGAREPHMRAIAAMMRRELSPTIWPTLAVMGTWRAAKLARAASRRCLRPARAGVE
jgi:tetraprenyl-beta-curcumene synthase